MFFNSSTKTQSYPVAAFSGETQPGVGESLLVLFMKELGKVAVGFGIIGAAAWYGTQSRRGRR